MPVATTTTLVTDRCSPASTQPVRLRPSRSVATVTQTAQPTCRLGIAAYWSAPADTVPLPQDIGGW